MAASLLGMLHLVSEQGFFHHSDDGELMSASVL
jgi:hypothetical protein